MTGWDTRFLQAAALKRRADAFPECADLSTDTMPALGTFISVRDVRLSTAAPNLSLHQLTCSTRMIGE